MGTSSPFNEYINQTPQKNDKSLLWACGLQDADHTPTLNPLEQPPLTSSAA